MMIMIPVSPGELMDKITILEIKADRLDDPEKRANVERERDFLYQVRDRDVPGSAPLTALVDELRTINSALWDIEEGKRACEREKRFGSDFVELARRVYLDNDRRAAVKRQINTLLGSSIVEEKSYKPY